MNKPAISKLFKLKKWLTLPEAARHLSVICEEDITEADIYRLALDGNLKLSVNLVNHAKGRCGELVGIESVEWGEFPAKWVNEIHNLPYEAKGKPLRYIKSLRVRDELFLNLDDKVTVIQGVWDLPMIGGEQINIEEKYQDLTDGPSVGLINLEGVFLERDGLMCQVQDSFGDYYGYETARRTQFDKLRRLELTKTNNRRKENLLLLRREKLKKLTEIEEKWRSKDRYYPAANLPEGHVLVVRTHALREFEQLISSNEKDKNVPTKPHGNSELNAQKREQILGAALSVVTQWADQCQNSSGKFEATKIAKLIDEKGLLFWPGTGVPPLERETMEREISKWINKIVK